MSYLYIGLILMILTISLLIIPNSIYKKDLIIDYRKSKFKTIYNIILFLKTILTIYIGAFIIQKMNFDMYSVYYFIIGIILTVIILSSKKTNEIVELSTWFVLTSIIISALAFLHMVDVDFTFLKVFNISIPNWTLYLIIPFIFSDNLLLLLTDKENIIFNKKSIILPLVLQFLFMTFELYQMLLASGNIIFNDYEFVGFISLSFQQTSNYIGNLKFVYLYIITMSTVINSSYNLSIIRHSYSVKKRYLPDILLIVLIGITILFISKLKYSLISNLLLYLSLIGLILIVWIMKEIYNVRKTKR